MGLAPAAFGGNRTGRVFTGDRSGDFLFAALYRAGLANQPTSEHRDDGLKLTGVLVTAAMRCAPPDNRPAPEELRRCLPYLSADLAGLADLRVILALGKVAHDAVRVHMTRAGGARRPRWRFAHGLEHPLGDGVTLVDSYHVSQRNTFTGLLSPEMFDTILARCRELAWPSP